MLTEQQIKQAEYIDANQVPEDLIFGSRLNAKWYEDLKSKYSGQEIEDKAKELGNIYCEYKLGARLFV